MKSRQITKRTSVEDEEVGSEDIRAVKDTHYLLKDDDILQFGDLVFLKQNNKFVFSNTVYGWQGYPVNSFINPSNIHYRFYRKRLTNIFLNYTLPK